MLASARAGARGRAPLRRRRVARAAEPDHRAARERGLPAAPRRRPRDAGRRSTPTPSGCAASSTTCSRSRARTRAASPTRPSTSSSSRASGRRRCRASASRPTARSSSAATGAALERALGTWSTTPIATALPAARFASPSSDQQTAVALAVTDAGDGIPPDLAEMATGRFWRGPDAEPVGGSGLGLALVRATAERHGGAPIAGPRFAIQLPGSQAALRRSRRHCGCRPEGGSP